MKFLKLFSFLSFVFLTFFIVDKVSAKQLSYYTAGQNVAISYITDTWTGSPNPGTLQTYHSVPWSGYYSLPAMNCGVSSCNYYFISELRLSAEGVQFTAGKQYKLVATISSGDQLTYDFTRLNSYNTCYLGVNNSWTKSCVSSSVVAEYNGNGTGSFTVYFTPVYDSNGIAYYIGDTNNTNKNSYLNIISNQSAYNQGFRIESITVYSVDDTSEELNSINSSINTTNSKLNETNENLTDINDSINDDNIDSNNTTNTLNNLSGQVASNSVISDLLLLPVSLFQKILNSINGSCSTFSLGSLYGSNLNFPCIDLQSLLGSAIYNSIDVIISGIFILSIRKKFVNIFESLSSLKDGRNDLE